MKTLQGAGRKNLHTIPEFGFFSRKNSTEEVNFFAEVSSVAPSCDKSMAGVAAGAVAAEWFDGFGTCLLGVYKRWECIFMHVEILSSHAGLRVYKTYFALAAGLLIKFLSPSLRARLPAAGVGCFFGEHAGLCFLIVFACAAIVLKAFGVGEALSLLAADLVLHVGFVIFLIDIRLRVGRVCLPQACLSFASPKESHQRKGDPGIARKPCRNSSGQGAGITRLALPSRASNICRLKTLATRFRQARFTGIKSEKHLPRF